MKTKEETDKEFEEKYGMTKADAKYEQTKDVSEMIWEYTHR